MADTSQEVVRRPRPFTDTLTQIRYGELHDELTDALNEMVTKTTSANKASSLVLKIAIKPGKGGQIEIVDELKVTLPKEERSHTIMFATPEGNLQREDPRQRTFDGIRSVEAETRALRQADAAAPTTRTVRTA